MLNILPRLKPQAFSGGFCNIPKLLFSFGTEIGKWGRRNILARNLISLTAVVLATAYSIILATSLDRDSMLYALIIAAMSAYLIRFNAIELMGIMKETSEDLITENMSDVKVEPFGDYGESRILIGMANGKHNGFIMRGVDKILAKRIKKGNIKQVTMTYYASTHRLYAIQDIQARILGNSIAERNCPFMEEQAIRLIYCAVYDILCV